MKDQKQQQKEGSPRYMLGTRLGQRGGQYVWLLTPNGSTDHREVRLNFEDDMTLRERVRGPRFNHMARELWREGVSNRSSK